MAFTATGSPPSDPAARAARKERWGPRTVLRYALDFEKTYDDDDWSWECWWTGAACGPVDRFGQAGGLPAVLLDPVRDRVVGDARPVVGVAEAPADLGGEASLLVRAAGGLTSFRAVRSRLSAAAHAWLRLWPPTTLLWPTGSSSERCLDSAETKSVL
jgi:hypothetical protein